MRRIQRYALSKEGYAAILEGKGAPPPKADEKDPEKIKLGLLTAEVNRKLLNSLSEELETIVSNHLKESTLDPHEILKWLEQRFNSKRGENRLMLRRLYLDRRKRHNESWKSVIDDLYVLYNRYTEAGARLDEIDLIAQCLEIMKEGKFNESFISNWDVRTTDTWKWNEFYLEFSLFLIGKEDDRKAKKALAAGADEKKNDTDHKTDNQRIDCSKCGRRHPKKKCKAFGKTCNACGLKNHFATVCRNRQGGGSSGTANNRAQGGTGAGGHGGVAFSATTILDTELDDASLSFNERWTRGARMAERAIADEDMKSCIEQMLEKFKNEEENPFVFGFFDFLESNFPEIIPEEYYQVERLNDELEIVLPCDTNSEDESEELSTSNTEDMALGAGTSPLQLTIDSGANKVYLNTQVSDACPVSQEFVTTANGTKHVVSHRGFIEIMGKKLQAYYVPDFSASLLSVSALQDCGIEVKFPANSRSCILTHAENGFVEIPRINGLYNLTADHIALGAAGVHPLVLHRRHAHCTFTDSLPSGVKCEYCVMSAGYRQHRRAPPIDCGPGEIFSVDVGGPVTESLGGSKYFAVAIDEKTSLILVSFADRKNTVINRLIEEIDRVTNLKGYCVKLIRSDGAKEIAVAARNLRYNHQVSLPHDTRTRGKSERAVKTAAHLARVNLLSSRLPHFLWPEAMAFAISVRNRISGAYQEFFGNDGKDIDMNYEFGDEVIVKKPVKKLKKIIESANELAFFVGWDIDKRLVFGTRRSVRVFMSGSEDSVQIRDVISATGRNYRDIDVKDGSDGSDSEEEEDPFADLEEGNDQQGITPGPVDVPQQVPQVEAVVNAEVPMIEEADDVDPAQIPLPDDNAHDLESEDEKQPQNNDQDTEAPGVDQDEVVNEENAGPRRSSRAKAPVDYNVDNYYRSIGRKLFGFQANDDDLWIAAEKKEVDQLVKYQVFQVIDQNDLNPGEEILPMTVVKKKKLNEDGSYKSHKVRYTVSGNRENPEGLDTQAETLAQSSLFLIIALSAIYKWKLFFLDVEGAFLNAPLARRAVVRPTQFMKSYLNLKSSQVLLLKRALYGLRDSAKAWRKFLNDVLISIGFTVVDLDCCFYFFKSENRLLALLGSHVDDLTLGCNDDSFKAWLISALPFRVTESHGTSDERGIITSLPGKISEFLEFYGMKDSNARRIPMDPGFRINQVEKEDDALPALGRLLYISRIRFDIAYSVIYASRRPNHVALKGIARYLVDKVLKGFLYKNYNSQGVVKVKVVAMCDAEFARDNDGLSTGGHVVYIIPANLESDISNINSPIIYKTKKQSVKSDSSSLSEIVQAHLCFRDAIMIWEILNFIGVCDDPAEVQADNSNIMQNVLVGNTSRLKSRHVVAKVAYMRDAVERGIVVLKKIDTANNIADTTTKPLPREKFEHLFKLMNLVDVIEAPKAGGGSGNTAGTTGSKTSYQTSS
eukprot:TRINITY_DN9637_c0_g1_i6.p1 TRINITY_DN9637_c0_g1~~TRINITY_DN9637_c0_g1_i6.p1  ORF type:complete len:1451 (+),score=405.89 TRINITY_DN9637_c0_g1_i6:148-4500(+)